MNRPARLLALPLLALLLAPGLTAAAPRDLVFWRSFAPIGDLDGDGADDVLETRNGARMQLLAYAGADGALLWTHEGKPGETLVAKRLGDVSGDGRDDVLLAVTAGDKRAFGSWAVAARSGADGSLLWSRGLAIANQPLIEWLDAAYVAPDHNLDGRPDVALHTSTYPGCCFRTSYLTLLDGRGGHTLWALPDASSGGHHVLENVTGGPRPDVLHVATEDGYGVVTMLDGDTRRPAWTHRGVITARPLEADLDGDGRRDIAVNSLWPGVLGGATGALIWSRLYVPNTTMLQPSPLYLTGPLDDGAGSDYVGILSSAGAATTTRYDGATGDVLFSTTLSPAAPRLHLVGDHDGDGARDMLFVLPSIGNTSQRIRVESSATGAMLLDTDLPGKHWRVLHGDLGSGSDDLLFALWDDGGPARVTRFSGPGLGHVWTRTVAGEVRAAALMTDADGTRDVMLATHEERPLVPVGAVQVLDGATGATRWAHRFE